MTEIPFTSDRKTRWVFLSPHLDDAVFSCGGLISYLSEKGISTQIWTVFSDQTQEVSELTPFAQSLHSKWHAGDHPYIPRKEEDSRACKTVGAQKVHFGYLDCIYRRFPETNKPMVSSDEDLFRSIAPEEFPLVDQITADFRSRLEEPSIWVSPLSLGNHLDHRVVRSAAEKMRKLLLYYADLPYAFSIPPQSIPGMIQFSFDIPETNLNIWGKGVLQYSSQISSFWKNEKEMVEQYSAYLKHYNGLPLWLPKQA
jgi:LmbE family N-acetylglucosaminyl deacetylase